MIKKGGPKYIRQPDDLPGQGVEIRLDEAHKPGL